VKNVQTQRRSGAILIAVLGCMLIAISLVFAGVKNLVCARQECKDARLVRQTELLVEAGVTRALDKLRSSSGYQGEVWQPELASVEAWKPTVVIREEQESSEDDSKDRKFTVVAKLQSNAISTQSIQKTFQFKVHSSEP
jgi:Na+-transporting NADH:ubiquinone oxidoreductase subunit NqrC